jgi:serine/threonine protein kinase
VNDHPTLPYSPSSTTADIPDFVLIRPIGEGGFGQVWLATNQATGQLRAVKLIPLDVSDRVDPAGRELMSLIRLERVAQQRHPHLTTIHHVGRTPQHLFYVMDLADDLSGGPPSADAAYQPATLSRRLEHGPLAPEDCLLYCKQLLSALACLHQAGMVHRDVKPANCLFVGGRLQLADFGLLSTNDRSISRVGTEKYMPPTGRMDARADVFAAGLVIYEMLTGLPVERFPSLQDRGRQIFEDANLRRLNQLVLQACEPDPQHRFQDAGEMLTALEGGSRRGLPRLTRRRGLALAGVLLLASVLVAAAVWSVNREVRRSAASPVGGPSGVASSGVPPPVRVNFITEPFEATIYLDGKLLVQPDGQPYLTPCTVPDLPAGQHRVIFKRPDHADLPAGPIDLTKTREIVARWQR